METIKEDVRVCSKCRRMQPLTEFYKGNRGDGTDSQCRTCRSDKQKAIRKETIAKARLYLSNKGCKDCGNRDVRVLEFDHVHGEKEIDITSLMHFRWESNKLQQELAKCEVRCANCHKIRHWIECER